MTTLAAIGKKALLFLLGDKKGRKAVGYIIGIAVFLALLPLIIFMSLLGWLLGDGGEDLRGRMEMGEFDTEIAEPHEVQEGNCTNFGRPAGASVWFWRAEAGESRGGVRVRGGVTPSGKADRKGGFRGVFGSLQKSLRCRATMSETILLRGRNDVGKRGL